jgi:hypothetical protein
MFPRLFSGSLMSRSSTHVGHGSDCDCQSSHMSPGAEFSTMQGMPVQGAPMVMPAPTPIPITNLPVNQPPSLLRMPSQAAPTPYIPPTQ